MTPPPAALARPPAPVKNGSMWSAFARSVRNNAVAEVAVQVLRVGGMIVLARALAPQDFGLLKILVIVTFVSGILCEFGIPDALIQRRDLRFEHEAAAWWLSVALSSANAAALYLLAPMLAKMMAMRDLTFALRLLCIPLLLDGTSTTANARLRRELKFGALAAADVLGEAGFLVAALVLLYCGLTQWALAGGLAARIGVHGLTVWIADPWVRLGWPRVEAARDFWRFASTATGGKLVTTAGSNIDFVLVGRLLGSGALGFYAMAWDLLRFVPDRLYRVAGRVILPAFCKIQDDDAELRNAYFKFVEYVGRFVLPIAACIALTAPQVLGCIYGPKWMPAATPLRLLVVGLTLIGLRIGIGAIYYSKNHPAFDIYLNGARFVLIVGAIAATAGAGLFGVSAGVSAVEAVISIAGQYLVCKLIGLKPRKLLAACIPGLRLAVICLLAAAAGEGIGLMAGVHTPYLLALIAVPPAAAFAWLEASEVTQMAGWVSNRGSRTAPIQV